MSGFEQRGPDSSFDVGYARAIIPERTPAERTPAQKTEDASTVADNSKAQADLVRQYVGAMTAAAATAKPEDWTTAKGSADAAVAELERQVSFAVTAKNDSADPKVRERLATASKMLTEAKDLVARAPAARRPRAPQFTCADALLAVLPPDRDVAPVEPVYRPAESALKEIIRHQITESDIAAFLTIIRDHKDHEITRRFMRFGEVRRGGLLEFLKRSDIKLSARVREAAQRRAARDNATASGPTSTPDDALELGDTEQAGPAAVAAGAPAGASAAPAGASTAAPAGAETADDNETPSQPRGVAETGTTGSATTDASDSDEAPQRIPPQIRGELEQATGRSLGHVALHTGERGDATAKAHGARAVAIGSDIHMARGQLDVRSPAGRELLAHEVAHIAQADAHGEPPPPAAKREGNAPEATTDAAEAEADTFAAQFNERGAAARWTPSVAIGSRQAMRAPATATAKAAPTASATAPSTADPGRHTAAMYFADNQAQFFAAIHARLASAALPPPHARLVWGPDGLRGIAFERALVGACGTDMDLAYALRGLLHPVDPFELIDLHRDLCRGRPGERIDNQPAMGPVAWNPVVGQAVALEIEACLRRSLPRMGLRYVAQADDYHGQVSPEMLVTSEPFDRVVARLLCDPAVARFVPAHGKPDKRADTAAPAAFKNGIRLVMFEWQGARDRRLWNWIRVTEPADPRPEEVAASVFAGSDGENHTEHAYALTAAPPYFRIPPERARKFPAAAEHAPPEAKEDQSQASRSALALADSPLGDESARVQAGKPVARLDIAGLAHTFDQSDMQLKLASEQLSVWGFGHLVAPAQRWVNRHKDVVTAAPDKTLKAWAAIAAAQSSILGDALGDLSEVANLARTARVPPEASEARPFREVIEALAIAMGESHLAQTGEVQLATARQKKARLSLTLLDRTMRENHDAAQELTGTERVPVNEADHIDPRKQAASTNRTLERGSLALREKALATGSIDAAEMEALTVAAIEETLRARILTLYGKLNQLLDASDQATDGFFGHIGNARNADIWNLRTELVTLQPLAWNILETMRKEALPPHPVPQDPALARAAFAYARKQAVTNAQAAFAKLTEDKKLHTLYQRALNSVSDAQRNTAYFKLAVEIAVMIGVSVAGSVAGALVGSLVRGAILADAAVDAAAFARVATVARVAGGAVNIATDAAVQAGAQTAMFGGNTKLTFVENVMTNLMTLGALRPFHALTGELGRLDRSATGLWKVASAGKVVIAEAGKLTVETLVGAGATYVSARLVHGQPPPSDDVAISWAMQGASMAVGKFVHSRMGELTDRWAQLAEQKVHLFKRARAHEALARQVEHSGDTASALHLLEEHVRRLQDEHALLQDPAAVARLGLDAKQVGVLRAGNETALADTHSQSFEVTKLRFHGLEPLATNGLIWSGTRGQIEAAIAESGTAARNAREIATGRWMADIGGRQVTLVESKASRKSEIGRAPGTHGEHLPAPHTQRAELLPPVYSFDELGIDQNRIVGNPVSLEQGHDILRAVTAGDSSALTKLGLSGTPRLPKTASTEFGLGRTADGLVVVVCGEPHAVDWSKLPGVIPEGGAHASGRNHQRYSPYRPRQPGLDRCSVAADRRTATQPRACVPERRRLHRDVATGDRWSQGLHIIRGERRLRDEGTRACRGAPRIHDPEADGDRRASKRTTCVSRGSRRRRRERDGSSHGELDRREHPRRVGPPPHGGASRPRACVARRVDRHAHSGQTA